jgi:hypothetical protein
MTPQLWVALGFAAALVVFLMIAYFTKDRSTPNQQKILRLLSALCSGFAGGFFTGSALFQLEQQLPSGAKLLISGTAGFALFLVVLYTWKVQPEPAPPPPNRVIASFPEGFFTFEAAARAIVSGRGVVDFQGFQPGQLAIKLHAIDLDEATMQAALTKLGYGAYDRFPEYRVDVEGGVFHICKLESSHAGQ